MLIRAQLSLVIALSCLFFLEYSNALEFCNGTSWIKFGENCYLFPTAGIGRVSYYDAEDFCRSQGAHLASIHSEEENAFIKNTMKERHSGDRLWIGLNILAGKSNFLWSDDTPVGFTNIVKKEYYVNEKCFIMMRSQNGWRPEHCALHYAAVCKRPDSALPTPVPPPTTPDQSAKGYCPEGWVQLEEKCYKYFGADENERLQYKQARDACWALGENHDLVSIHSMNEQAFLTQHLFSLGTSAWIGMREVTSDEVGHDLVFGWIDNSRTDFTYWAPGHPPPGTWKYCTRLSFEGVDKGQWIADYCETSKQGYICQAPTDSDLPAPVIHPSDCGSDPNVGEFRDACYHFVPKLQNQQEAEEACQEMNGHLVSIVDSFEQAFLYNFIGHRELPVWTGLGRSEGSKYFKWTDKQPVYYMNFDEKESHLTSNDKKCVSLHSNNTLKWNTTHCSVKLLSICKIAKENPPSFPEVTGSCSSDENLIIDIGDKFCYHLAHDRKFHLQSWDATSRYCLTRGLKMIEGYSNHQMQSLTAYLHREMYTVHLGVIRSFDKKSFIPVNGGSLNYTNWDVKEPSSYPGTKDCVAFHPSTGKWSTISCNGIGVAVCKMLKK